MQRVDDQIGFDWNQIAAAFPQLTPIAEIFLLNCLLQVFQKHPTKERFLRSDLFIRPEESTQIKTH